MSLSTMAPVKELTASQGHASSLSHVFRGSNGEEVTQFHVPISASPSLLPTGPRATPKRKLDIT